MPLTPLDLEDRIEKLTDYSDAHLEDLVLRWNSTESHWEGYFDKHSDSDTIHSGELEDVIEALEADIGI